MDFGSIEKNVVWYNTPEEYPHEAHEASEANPFLWSVLSAQALKIVSLILV